MSKFFLGHPQCFYTNEIPSRDRYKKYVSTGFAKKNPIQISNCNAQSLNATDRPQTLPNKALVSKNNTITMTHPSTHINFSKNEMHNNWFELQLDIFYNFYVCAIEESERGINFCRSIYHFD